MAGGFPQFLLIVVVTLLLIRSVSKDPRTDGVEKVLCYGICVRILCGLIVPMLCVVVYSVSSKGPAAPITDWMGAAFIVSLLVVCLLDVVRKRVWFTNDTIRVQSPFSKAVTFSPEDVAEVDYQTWLQQHRLTLSNGRRIYISDWLAGKQEFLEFLINFEEGAK